MKGLFLNGFYATVGNMRIFMAVVFLAAAVLLATGNPTAQELFVYITITALSIQGVVSARKDSVSQWNKYEITMPVRRKDIVKCKYISYLFWVGTGTVLAAAVTSITMVIHGASDMFPDISRLYSMFVLGIGISVLTGTVFYPLFYLCGSDKSETVLMISVIVAVGASVFILSLLNKWLPAFSVRCGVFAAVYMLLFAVSYFLSLSVYLRKEF